MNQIRLYFAGAYKGKATEEEVKTGITNKLCSFLYPMQLDSWASLTTSIPGYILIDSGAFSAWNKGDTVDFDGYIQYCKEALADPRLKNKKIRVVNLDVIPGEKGKTKKLTSSNTLESKKIIDDAAKEGYKNLMYFKSKGIIPIHVFHQGENFDHLVQMIEQTDYIGISPANDLHMSQKQLWIDRVFSFIEQKNLKVDTHGFAVWSPSIILTYPWTSCDAATWRLVAGYGGVYLPVGGFSNPDFSQQPMVFAISERRVRFDWIPFSEKIKQMLKNDGYEIKELQDSWEKRCEVNIRYFLEFEKWVNIQKAKRDFKPTRTFGLR
jgi:hypothetical protein